MDAKIQSVLEKLFKDDKEALAAFVGSVDEVNRTVEDEKLIHRSTAETDVDEEETEETDEPVEAATETDVERDLLELDDVAIQHLAQQVIDSDALKVVTQSIEALRGEFAVLTSARQEDAQEIAALKTQNAKLTERVKKLAQSDVAKQQVWAEDLPARRTLQATYIPREQHGDTDEDESLATAAERTLSAIPSAY